MIISYVFTRRLAPGRLTRGWGATAVSPLSAAPVSSTAADQPADSCQACYGSREHSFRQRLVLKLRVAVEQAQLRQCARAMCCLQCSGDSTRQYGRLATTLHTAGATHTPLCLGIRMFTATVRSWASMRLPRCYVARECSSNPLMEPSMHHCRCAAQLLAAMATLQSGIRCSSHRMTARVSRHSGRLPKESHTASSRRFSRHPLQLAMDSMVALSVKPRSSGQ